MPMFGRPTYAEEDLGKPLPPMTPVSERVLAWMEAKRRKIVVERVRAAADRSRRRGAKRTLVVVEDLDLLLGRE